MKKINKKMIIVIAFVIAMGLAVRVQAADPVCYLPLNEASWNIVPGEVVDYSGYGNSGIGYSGATTVSGGISGSRCGIFDGVNDFVQIESNASMRNLTAKTVMLWVKPALGVNGKWGVAYEAGYWSAPYGDLIATYNDNGVMNVDMYVRSNDFPGFNYPGTFAHILTPISATDWTMVGYTWDGTTVKFYVNGTQVGSDVSMDLGTAIAGNVDAYLGNSGGNYYQGNIDEVRIYNVALTAAEVVTVYTMPSNSGQLPLSTEWTPLEKVNVAHSQVGNVYDVVVNAQNGKMGLAYFQQPGGTWGTVYYNEYTYGAGSLGLMTKTIDEEALPAEAVGLYGTYLTGIGFSSSGQVMIGTTPWAVSNSSPARVLTRAAAGIYTVDDATVTSDWGSSVWHESFKVDSLGKPHYVWASAASGSQQIIYGDKSSGSWVNTVMVTPASPGSATPDLSVDVAGYPQICYRDASGVRRTWKDGGGVHDQSTSAVLLNTSITKADMEMNAAGQPMFAYLASGSSVKVATYNGASWDVSTVIPALDARDYGWYGSDPVIDLEVDGNGNPVVAVVHSNYATGWDQSYVDYYVYQGGGWSGSTIAIIPTADKPFSLDLTFDESGRPFIAVLLKNLGNSYFDVYYTTKFSTETLVCGDYGTVYLGDDFNKDCYVNLLDLNVLVQQWLECTTPGIAGCEASSIVPPPYDIYPGSVTVDGDLSDWSGVAWIAMDKVLYGLPSDLTSAKWAAKWDSVTNRIYVAVTGIDSYRYFSDTDTAWDGQDEVEIYVDAANSDEWELSTNGYIYAQQWAFGPDAGATQDIWGGGYWGNLHHENAKPAGSFVTAAVNVTGNVISYEFAIRPYSEFYYNNPSANVEVTLAPGAIVGLDVVMGTRTSSGFGMWCENLDGGKAEDALMFQNYTLKAAGSGTCGSWGYMTGDLNSDCKVNFTDFASYAQQWMDCTDPANSDCD